MEEQSKGFIDPKKFLENWPLYTTANISGEWRPPNAISRDCGTCAKETTWHILQSSGITGQGLAPFNVRYLPFCCTLCKETHVAFLVYLEPEVRVERDVSWCIRTLVRKIGQFPAPSITVPSGLSRRLGNTVELYRKALICRNQGYGIATLAYFRRIIEDKTNDLIDIVADYAASHDASPEDVERLRAAKESQPYSDRLKVAATVLPRTLQPEGVNPLETLYGLYSRGLHLESEENCIEIADEMNAVFEYIFMSLKAEIESRTEFLQKVKRAVKRLSGRQESAPK